eukprot:m.401871 g.401871  ORF g.401871 m.401871 type:complete len:322 (-) comp21170_c1_seq7:121-1086(-)
MQCNRSETTNSRPQRILLPPPSLHSSLPRCMVRTVMLMLYTVARIHAVETGQETFAYTVDGLACAVAYSPDNTSRIFVATSRKTVHCTDLRMDPATQTQVLTNDATVSAIVPLWDDSALVLTGDTRGCVRTWDRRTGKCVDDGSMQVSAGAVSALAVVSNPRDMEYGRFVAVNSHDNMCRLYDRGSLAQQQHLHLYASAHGHDSKGWPVQCSLFHAASHAHTQSDNARSTQNMLLAVGGVDGDVRVYDASGTHSVAPLLYRLRGHTGRVYGVCFHPDEAVLASCSEDGTARVRTSWIIVEAVDCRRIVTSASLYRPMNAIV